MEDYDDEDDENDDDDGDDDGDDDDDKFDNDDNDDNDANDDVENCRGPDWAQNVDTHTLCELAHRNACPHVTRVIRRATSWGKLKEKCHGPKGDTHTQAPLRSRVPPSR